MEMKRRREWSRRKSAMIETAVKIMRELRNFLVYASHADYLVKNSQN